ncbi:translational machinery protein [Aestuariivirga litoralis]|uniref:translational machinery protein n=1 Tax=Aestuariivirga litoralis TaxID=2650924 RepID=UPI0018C4726E|nr:translational machinery protein [Aestuariivirga litoralis]MBG1232795.1 translational machinery protein [Aestuariivirga litoralis]
MSSSHFHAVIWLDHRQAKVFHFNAREEDSQSVHAQDTAMHLHHKANTIGSGHEVMEPAFMNEIALAVSESGEVLVIGPGNAKTEFMTYLEKYSPKLKAKILGVETVDHPSDGEIVAYARKFFKPVDAMILH